MDSISEISHSPNHVPRTTHLFWDFDNFVFSDKRVLISFYDRLLSHLVALQFARSKASVESRAFGTMTSFQQDYLKVLRDMHVAAELCSSQKKEETDRVLERSVRHLVKQSDASALLRSQQTKSATVSVDDTRSSAFMFDTSATSAADLGGSQRFSAHHHQHQHTLLNIVVVSSDKDFIPLMRELVHDGHRVCVVHDALPSSEHKQLLEMFVTLPINVQQFLPEWRSGVGADQQPIAMIANGNFQLVNAPPLQQPLLKEWICTCGFKNFKHRNVCLSCKQPRPSQTPPSGIPLPTNTLVPASFPSQDCSVSSISSSQVVANGGALLPVPGTGPVPPQEVYTAPPLPSNSPPRDLRAAEALLHPVHFNEDNYSPTPPPIAVPLNTPAVVPSIPSAVAPPLMLAAPVTPTSPDSDPPVAGTELNVPPARIPTPVVPDLPPSTAAPIPVPVVATPISPADVPDSIKAVPSNPLEARRASDVAPAQLPDAVRRASAVDAPVVSGTVPVAVVSSPIAPELLDDGAHLAVSSNTNDHNDLSSRSHSVPQEDAIQALLHSPPKVLQAADSPDDIGMNDSSGIHPDSFADEGILSCSVPGADADDSKLESTLSSSMKLVMKKEASPPPARFAPKVVSSPHSTKVSVLPPPLPPPLSVISVSEGGVQSSSSVDVSPLSPPEPKTSPAQPPSQPTPTPSYSPPAYTDVSQVFVSPPTVLLPGDWVCTSCGTTNFKSAVCFKCCAPSPL